MKALIVLIGLLYVTEAFTQAKPVSMKGQADAAYQLPKQEIQVPFSQYTNLGGLAGLIETGNFNALVNPGGEHSTGGFGWSIASGTLGSTNAFEHSGLKSISATASISTPILTQTVTTNIAELTGQQGVASAWVKHALAVVVQVCAIVDNAEVNCVNTVGDASWKEYVIPFVFGATNYGVRVKALSSISSGSFYVDDAYVGFMPSSMSPEVAQPRTGHIKTPFNSLCGFSISTTTMSAFAADTDCARTVNGAIVAAPATFIPGIVVKAGTGGSGGFLDFNLSGPFTTQRNATSSPLCNWELFDGTNSYSLNAVGSVGGTTVAQARTAAFYTRVPLTAALSVDTTYQLRAKADNVATGCSLNLNEADTAFEIGVTAHVPSSKIYSQACSNPLNCENVFSANLDSAGTVSGENLDFINGNAASGGTGIKTITWNTGIFTADPNCVLTVVGGSSATNELHIEISASSSTSLTYETASTGADANFAAKLVCQKSPPDYKAQNQITGTFANVVTAPGISKPKTCYYAFGGASATLAAPTECTSGTCVEVVDTCAAATPPTWASTSLYNNLLWANGTWANSTALKCDCIAFDATTSLVRECTQFFTTGGQSWATNSSGGAELDLISYDNAGSQATSYIMMKCTGQAP